MNKIKLTLLDSMGDFKSVANAARCSFGKTADKYSDAENTKLVKYLARNNHWTPMCSLQASIHVELPLVIHAQLVKHVIGGTINTMSRRYVRGEVDFFAPEWREAPENGVKQGSGDTHPNQDYMRHVYGKAVTAAHDTYKYLLRMGVAPEQARFVLPVSQMTKCVVVGSAVYFARIYKQRSDPHAQKEWESFCLQLDEICGKIWPITWKELICTRDSKNEE